MCQPLVYLAGPIKGTSYGTATGWREYVKESLNEVGVKCLSPLRGNEWLAGVEKLEPSRYGDNPLTTQTAITRRDSSDIVRADLVFVNLLGATHISQGTNWELGIAYILQKLVVLVMEPEGNPHHHTMVLGSATYWVHELETGISVTKSALLP